MATAARVHNVPDVIPTAPRGVEQKLGELLIRQLPAPADVVKLTRPALLHDQLDAAAVIGHEQPVADVLPLAVERYLLAIQQIRDEQRDNLLRKMIWPVVVAASRDGD